MSPKTPIVIDKRVAIHETPISDTVKLLTKHQLDTRKTK